MFANFEEETRVVLVTAKKEMKELKHPYIGSEHMLLAILKHDNDVTKKLAEYKINYNSFKKEVINIPCEKVNVIDTTGAGDVFCGSLTYMLSKDKDLHESVLYASKMASESVKYHCVIPSILHLKKL